MGENKVFQDLTACQQAYKVLQQVYDELERRVKTQTSELRQANEELQTALEELTIIEEELRSSNEELIESRQVIELERQRYHDLFEFAPDGYLVTDIRGSIQQANQAAATLLSTQQQYLIGKPLVVFIAEPERKAFRTRLAQLQEAQGWEVYLKPPSREPFPAMLAVTSIHDEQGQQVGWRWLLCDISDRKLAEQRLAMSESQYRLLFERNPNPMWIFDPQILGFLAVNQAAIAHYGYSESEFLSMTLVDIRPPEDIPNYQEWIEQYRFNDYEFVYQGEWRHCKRDGSIIDVEITSSRIIWSGKLADFVMVKDITEHKQAQETLRRSEEQRRLVLDLTDTGFWDWNLATNKVIWNENHYHLFGLIPNSVEANYQLWRDRVHPEDIERVEQEINYALDTQTEYETEYRVIHPDGSHHWLLARGRGVYDDSGQAVRMLGMLFDISDRKCREANAAFLSEIAEDLSRLSSADEIVQAVGAKVGSYLGISNCTFIEIDEVQDRAIVEYTWHTADTPDAIGVHRLSDFITEELRQAVRAGETVAIRNTQTDPRTDKHRFAALNKQSFVSVPFHRDGQWKYSFTVYDSVARDWREDEIELICEVTNRIFPRLERARAEAAVAADLKDTQLLREVSARSEDNIQVLYNEIVAAAIALMRADGGSFQILHEPTQELLLLASQNFNQTLTEHFDRVGTRCNTSCGIALAIGERSLINFDVPESDDPNGYLRMHLNAGYLCAQSTPLISRLGKPIGMVSTHWRNHHQPSDRELRFLDLLARQAADLIEQRQAQEKIQEQAALLDVTIDAIFVCDLECRILYCNSGAERMYGWQAAEVLGKNFREFSYKQISTSVEEALKTVVEQGGWQGELNKVTKSGQEIIVSSRWTLIRDDTGQPKSILTVNTDITEKKQLETQFYRVQRLESLGTLASGIAHDLNNILAPILTIAQLLPLKLPNLNEQNRRLLNILENNSKRGSELVKQVTAFARGVEGKRVSLQPRHILKEIEQVVKSTFPKSIEICVNITTPNLWKVSADPTQIHQVLMNLCVNARDAMPQGGILTICAENFYVDENYAKMALEAKVGNYVVITVSDRGCGMLQEVLERIFEPFFTTKQQGQGTGLGLSTVIGIIKNHGGFIKVYSEVGEGSQFQVYLSATETSVTQETDESEMVRGNGELILVVDDEAFVRDVAKTSLEQFNYKVLVASDSFDAFSLYVQNKNEISVVLMDIQMPSIDGLNAIRVLQQINSSVQIIVISGLASNHKLLKDSHIDVQAFLTKPYTIKELLNTIKEVLTAAADEKFGNG
ncbi:PAS domain S-box protein [Dendronalium sp. ChiSLP03b]|uniref:PAS domain S-box protein n=1 Tax=Dendronalium sp. ChiSLP03b TaxID=3075381 RepID=UPI002AD515F6|nr:PAS domain S-box protein [Dendronalium sp. ChiSLP03b]MDZ8206263.1 PAS domain S-box protein [Dendronalium sp. ChiSLP03b]